MMAHFKLPEQNAIAARAARLAEAGVDREIVLGVMRMGGLSKIDSIRLLGELMAIPLMQAKTVIERSRAWSQTFSRDKEFQARLTEARLALDEDERA